MPVETILCHSTGDFRRTDGLAGPALDAEIKDHSNDHSTSRPEYQFPGLKPGDGWCLCALRWSEAYEAGVAPPVKPEATHAKALEIIDHNIIKQFYIQK